MRPLVTTDDGRACRAAFIQYGAGAMPRLFSILALVLTLIPGACSKNPRDEARARLGAVNTDDLRYDAARIYKQAHAVPGPEFVVLKPDRWPESFKKLKPLRVGIYRDGFAFALGGEAETEWGIHVYPTGMTQGRAGKAGLFEKLADGVFWYKLSR